MAARVVGVAGGGAARGAAMAKAAVARARAAVAMVMAAVAKVRVEEVKDWVVVVTEKVETVETVAAGAEREVMGKEDRNTGCSSHQSNIRRISSVCRLDNFPNLQWTSNSSSTRGGLRPLPS